MTSAVLHPGDTIGVFSPSSALGSLDELEPAQAMFKERGYNVYIHPQTGNVLNQSAGTNEEKRDALHSLLQNPDIKVIWASRGGNRASQFLDLIDYDLWKKNPKPIIGNSDVTVLHCAGLKKSNVFSIQGPTFQKIGTSLSHTQFDYVMNLLEGKPVTYPLNNAKTVTSGKHTGTLIGGTLFLIQSMIGTQYMPDMEGAILYLEDVGEELSRIDRGLQHLKSAIPFEKLGGIMFGEFVDMKDTGMPYGFTIEDIILEHTKGLNIPILSDIPFGHGKNMFALPFGSEATLDTSTTTPKLTF